MDMVQWQNVEIFWKSKRNVYLSRIANEDS